MNTVQPYAKLVNMPDLQSGIALLRKIEWCGRISHRSNAEHLINIANYAHLECYAPEHKRFHFDNTVDSATRKRVF